jgi:hypothetical protein
MNNQLLAHGMTFFGIFLIGCGIISVIFIGLKAKTALISGGMSGSISLLISYLIFHRIEGAHLAAVIFSFALFIVFSWRATKTLFAIFDLLAKDREGLQGKGIAFLIISLMAIVSFMVFAVQLVFFLGTVL